MKKAMTLLTVSLFVLTVLSCAISEKTLKESGAAVLNQQQLMELFSQERVVKLSSRSGSVNGYYFPDGTQKMLWPGGGDEGRYEINNGQFCSKWKATRSGKEECYRIYHTEGHEYIWVKLDGSYDSKMVITE